MEINMSKDNNKHVGLVGCGFVGSALKKLLEKEYRVIAYDPYISDYKSEAHKFSINQYCDIAFICVPTPLKWALKEYDLSALNQVLSWLNTEIIVIKSTLAPGDIKKLAKKYKKRLVHNPEFLREQTAEDDMINATRTILGGDIEDCKKVCQLYQKVYDSDMVYVFIDSDESEAVKQITNSYLATKVVLFNEFANCLKALGIHYEKIREILLLEPRIGRNHTLITENKGFGGHCFPKDLNSFIGRVEKKGYNPTLLKSIWNFNCKIRKEFKGYEYKK